MAVHLASSTMVHNMLSKCATCRKAGEGRVCRLSATHCSVSLLQSLNTSCSLRSLVSGSTPHAWYSSSRSVSVRFHLSPAARLLRSQSSALQH